MPHYLKEALKQFQHIAGKLQHAPYSSIPIQYDTKKQYATQKSTSPLVEDKAKRFLQQVCGKFLFLGRAVDSTLLCLISAIASQSSKPTEDTMRYTLQLLDYLATQEDAVLSYHASDMVLAVHSDASYLSEPKARSRAGGHFFLSSDTTIPPNNGAVLNIAHIIKMSCHRPPKQNLRDSTSWHVKRYTSESSLKNYATSNLPHHYKRTTQWRTPSSMVRYNPNEQKPWT
jgi:hypothetical protein